MFDDRLIDVLRRGFVVWLVIIFAESIHGVARRLLVEPFVGDFRARQVAVLIGSIIILAITFVFVRWLKSSKTFHFIMVGAMWVVLTVGFEILLGRIVMGLSWDRIASDYNLAEGGLMIFGMIVMLLAPLMMAKLEDVV